LKINNLAKPFPAFQERNYHLHFWGQFVSFIGFWLQLTAQSWRVRELTQSNAKVGFIVGLPILIAAIVAPFGGVIADRKDKRKVLYCIQAVSATLCFSLAAMFFCHCESVARMIVVNILLGISLGIDNPTRNSLIPDLIKKENIVSGIALNGAMVMSAQAIGPGLAACFLVCLNAGWAFIASGLAPLAVVLTLPFMRPMRTNKKLEEHPVKTFFAGMKYTFCSDPLIRLCVIICGFAGMLGFSYRAVLPGIAKEVYKAGPEIVGWLAFFAGVGSFAGAVFISWFSKVAHLHVRRLVVIGCTAAGTGFVVFAATSQLWLGSAFLFLAGFGFTMTSSAVRSVSQTVAEPQMRGRVTGLTMAIFFGGIAIGNFASGLIAESFGCPASMAICGISFLILAFLIFVVKRK